MPLTKNNFLLKADHKLTVLAEFLYRGGIQAHAITGGLRFSHIERENHLSWYDFLKSKQGYRMVEDRMVLVLTEHAAPRDLDEIPSADIVVNYDIPSDSDSYIPTCKCDFLAFSLATHSQEDDNYVMVEKLVGDYLPEFCTEEEHPEVFSQFRETRRMVEAGLTYGELPYYGPEIKLLTQAY